jgi:hypothetical protein
MSSLLALSRVKSQGRDISSPQAGFQRWLPDLSGPRPGHVRISDTPTARFPWGTIKTLHASLAQKAMKWTWKHSQAFSIGLKTPLPQASLQSKLPRRDFSHTFEWPTRSSTQALRRWSPCVRYSWGFVPLDIPGCLRVTKFVLPSHLWGFDSGNQTRSWWSFGVD